MVSVHESHKRPALWPLLLATTIGFALLMTFVATHTSMSGQLHMAAASTMASQTEQRVAEAASPLMAELPAASAVDETRSEQAQVSGSSLIEVAVIFVALTLCVLALTVVFLYRYPTTLNDRRSAGTTSRWAAFDRRLLIANLTTWRQLGVLRV
ncbi:MAG: hypothetical protein B7Y93_03235 [Micrococcales bacterium 32-70-13]|nr:MAG: hypothetical protein B7Y93_03235 [Micrococcales bacterium 32-70-13]